MTIKAKPGINSRIEKKSFGHLIEINGHKTRALSISWSRAHEGRGVNAFSSDFEETIDLEPKWLYRKRPRMWVIWKIIDMSGRTDEVISRANILQFSWQADYGTLKCGLALTSLTESTFHLFWLAKWRIDSAWSMDTVLDITNA